LCLTLLLAAVPGFAWADTISLTNSVRSYSCSPGKRMTPLRKQNDLDETARRLARGDSLEKALKRARYRAPKSTAIYIRSAPTDDAVARLLSNRYCKQLTDPVFSEIGAIRMGKDVWIVLAQPFSAPAPAEARNVSRRTLELVNAARAKPRRCGRKVFTAAPPLRLTTLLSQAALVQARDMTNRSHMSHTGGDGSSPMVRVTRTGYRWTLVGENVASGQVTAEEVVGDWLRSPSHCANIMDARFSEMGIAYFVNPNSKAGIYWSQVLAVPESSRQWRASR
jgi:uncharacterized protein YkwD